MIQKNAFAYRLVEPGHPIADFVYCFSALTDVTDLAEGIIIPNGKIDLVFSYTTECRWQVYLLGLETQPKSVPQNFISRFFSISFHPLALEYILQLPVAHLLNKGQALPDDFMGFSLPGPNDFDAFCRMATEKITMLLPATVDARKRDLFRLILAQQGEINVQALSEKIGWPPRQINAYFNRQLGIPLKAYCNILRFQASLQYIREGKLYPQLDYADQSHFIKEVRKLSGVSPKELRKNEHNRFLQFLVELK